MKDFNDIYQKIYKETYYLLQEKRKKIAKRIGIVMGIAIIIGLILCYKNENILFIFSFISIGIVCTILFTSNIRKVYRKIFKENVIGSFVKQYNGKLNYEYNRGVSALMYSRGEFEKFDNFHSEDYIYGLLENEYKIFMSEVHTEWESIDDECRKTSGTIFRGLFAQVEFDKNIKDTIKIRKNSLSIFNNKRKIEMDSGQFEQIYDVYSNGKIVTMQLFTAEIMDKFIEFKENNKIAPELTLKGNKLYIRFKTGDVFESNLLKRPLEYNTLKKYYSIINFTLEITELILKNIKETEI